MYLLFASPCIIGVLKSSECEMKVVSLEVDDSRGKVYIDPLISPHNISTVIVFFKNCFHYISYAEDQPCTV